ncbi:hypothetical protein A3841_00805 [Pontibacter flavimaris]|uniref:Uncharacterized protein n=1 Tax=Pontibacter flavimaris TaxID=1797110 RepID=A0A1Q5PBL9_9BACT|nr:hypothetical protein A3841_00805 [Pontibacter flavimaris]
MTKHFCRYLLLLFIVLSGCKGSEVEPQKALTLEEQQLLLGNPSGATADAGSPEIQTSRRLCRV